VRFELARAADVGAQRRRDSNPSHALCTAGTLQNST
jgi:hypothetical protein